MKARASCRLLLVSLLFAGIILTAVGSLAVEFESRTFYELSAADSIAAALDGRRPAAGRTPYGNRAVEVPRVGRPVVIAGIDNRAEVFLRELGNRPSPEEEQRIRLATDILKGTKVGAEIAGQVGSTNFPDGSWDGLHKAGVEITTRDLNRHIPIIDAIASKLIGSSDYAAVTPQPSWIQGRTIVCLDATLVASALPARIATLLAHEISHVADNRLLGEARTGTSLIGEQKATAIGVLLTDELLRTGLLPPDPSSTMQFLAAVYRWKIGGPRPNLNIRIQLEDKAYTGGELVGLYVKPSDDGLQAIMRLTRAFYPRLANQLPPKDDMRAIAQYAAKVKALKEIEEKFQQWYPSKPPPTPPAPPPPPPVVPPTPPPTPPDEDNRRDRGGGGGGGGRIDPRPPMPSPNPWG